VLSINSSLQTAFSGSYRPGRKRLGVTGTWTRFGYDKTGLRVTDATLLNATVSYRLRRLVLQAGYSSSNSRAYLSSASSAFRRREIYFEVIRRFSLF
jgi:hypothetical protein